VTWGKVDKDTYLQTTESLQADYSMVMPFLVKALLDNHAKRAGYRLYEQRDALCDKLREDVRTNRDWLLRSIDYPLA
jgi:deoxyhypusine synthase